MKKGKTAYQAAFSVSLIDTYPYVSTVVLLLYVETI